MEAWKNFNGSIWKEEINVQDFIISNYEEYKGDESFLKKISNRTALLLNDVEALLREERIKGGVLDIDVDKATSLTHYGAGYINKELEIIVGLQTDQPLKRGVNPFGGIRMAKQACEAYGYKMSDDLLKEFTYRTTHNDGVYRVYSDEMKLARKLGLMTGLPDAYGRGRIIGDYRRVALYGVDKLIEEKDKDKRKLAETILNMEAIRSSEELYQQIDFLKKLKIMANIYGIDISKPASNAKEAIQWLYFGYLGAIKEQNGAAMSLGRVSTFLDIYIQRDIDNGILKEEESQELIDQLVLKLRLARHLRTPEYNDLFAGDPMWITECIGGMKDDNHSLVTKTSYRFMHTLYNLKSSPEPNMTILYADKLPYNFKKYCAKVSIDTDSIQYENDDLMRNIYGNDYGIACCVSAMKLGKQMQFFGARCNFAKLLLLSINGGIEEMKHMPIGPQMQSFSDKEPLDYNKVLERFREYQKWMAHLYVNTMNVIHYMHDKYAYEKLQMALHDTDVERFMAFGIAGLSVVVDSLSAIKYAKVYPIKNSEGIIEDYRVEGDYPTYGNDDDRVDNIATLVTNDFINNLRSNETYRNSIPTLSVLTITSNVVYGKKTGNTPDGRRAGTPFAPGANPMHNREKNGALAALNSVSKISYDDCRDGISNTFSIIPSALGTNTDEQSSKLVNMLDGYFKQDAHHLNVNVLDKAKLIDAQKHPELYPTLTIRVSGYAVRFVQLSNEQQKEVISRTFHEGF
ncbi:MAG: formate C-acetyltransferase [Erysipelotrichaceae bacterium]